MCQWINKIYEYECESVSQITIPSSVIDGTSKMIKTVKKNWKANKKFNNF